MKNAKYKKDIYNVWGKTLARALPPSLDITQMLCGTYQCPNVEKR